MLDIRRVLVSAPKKHTEETLNSLTTVWGEALDSSNVLPEYPRSRMQRDNYVMLNGVWDYAIVPVDGGVDVETLARQAIPSRWDGQIVVPFSPEAPLSGVLVVRCSRTNFCGISAKLTCQNWLMTSELFCILKRLTGCARAL